MEIVKRFISYAKMDTQSDPNSLTFPSTSKQKELARLLLKELEQLKISAFKDEYGYLYGKVPKTVPNKPSIGFIAHMDTSFDAPGFPVKPRIIKNYDGSTIKLNETLSMDKETFPALKEVINDDLIVTDGNTLLGADNKAGIAIIMDFLQVLKESKLEHGDIYIAFTPDEEIGQGTKYFNYDFFKADFAYTVDGGKVGTVEYENFNAASAKVTFTGKSIHPGDAKNRLVNALQVAFKFNSMLPPFLDPANTENKEGFNHLTSASGTVEKAELNYIIRNHDYDLFLHQQRDFHKIKDYLNDYYGYQICEVEINESYLNMYEILKKDLTPIKLATQAIKNIGLTPTSPPIRGGTDGARLTYQGLPCPNLGTGGFNFHGRFEFLSINQMKKAVLILKEIVKIA
ncbi:MAG: peptidase T [Acholeplasmataceae bacterium]|jgi:tripeptide aminopeptidase|nr:peptidase T [Acholeplasmataceae bacterium]MCK9233598.1 peptidase T [Acholeplasmataceae bacterium]MCK9427336.1 peptidase T [Acholeplasmataceae bacterium]